MRVWIQHRGRREQDPELGAGEAALWSSWRGSCFKQPCRPIYLILSKISDHHSNSDIFTKTSAQMFKQWMLELDAGFGDQPPGLLETWNYTGVSVLGPAMPSRPRWEGDTSRPRWEGDTGLPVGK